MHLQLPLQFVAQLELLISRVTDPLYAIAAQIEALTLTVSASSPSVSAPAHENVGD